MTTLTEDKIQSILSTVIDENTGKDLVSSDNVKNISVDDEIVNVELLLKYPAANFHEELKGCGHLWTLSAAHARRQRS